MTESRTYKRIEVSLIFNKQLRACPPEIKVAFQEAFELFEMNPIHEALRDRPLTGKYAGFRSIDVTGDWRALYRTEAERILFIAIGTHEELYG